MPHRAAGTARRTVRLSGVVGAGAGGAPDRGGHQDRTGDVRSRGVSTRPRAVWQSLARAIGPGGTRTRGAMSGHRPGC